MCPGIGSDIAADGRGEQRCFSAPPTPAENPRQSASLRGHCKRSCVGFAADLRGELKSGRAQRAESNGRQHVSHSGVDCLGLEDRITLNG